MAKLEPSVYESLGRFVFFVGLSIRQGNSPIYWYKFMDRTAFTFLVGLKWNLTCAMYMEKRCASHIIKCLSLQCYMLVERTTPSLHMWLKMILDICNLHKLLMLNTCTTFVYAQRPAKQSYLALNIPILKVIVYIQFCWWTSSIFMLP